MKKTTCLAVLIVMFCFTSVASAQIKIKLGVVTKPGSAQNIVAEKFKELLENRSGGEVFVKIYHSRSIGNETEILQQVQMNTIQMAVVTGGPFDTFDPIVRVINYPFLFRDGAQADMILDGAPGQEILKSLETSGFKGLCFSENGFRNLSNSKRPVKKPEDVKGLKIRVMASGLHRSIWQAIGANPTPMPWPIYSELEQGVIDGQENPLWVMDVYKLYEIQKYMTLTRHVYSPHISVASLAWWNKQDEGIRILIQDAIRDAAVYQRALNREKDVERLAFLKEKGMVVEENPDLSAFRKQVADIKNMKIYSDKRVHNLLERVLEAVK